MNVWFLISQTSLMDSSLSPFTFLPPPLQTPPDINITLSTLKHLIHLSKTTLLSLPTLLPTTPTTATCPYNSNHLIPPPSLFHHHLRCPSSPSPIHPSLLHSLHYPNTSLNHNNNNIININNINYNNNNTDLCISLNDYSTSLDPNFFYTDSPAVVTFPFDDKRHDDVMLTLPAVLSAECADFKGDGGGGDDDVMLTLPAALSTECADFEGDGDCGGDDDVMLTLPAVLSAEEGDGGGGDDVSIDGLVRLLPSEWWNVRVEVGKWNSEFPSVYSGYVVKGISCCWVKWDMEDLKEWVLVNSGFYGVVVDVFMRDHMVVLFTVCLKAVVKEAAGYLVGETKGGGGSCFGCPVLVRVLTWLGSQFGVLYGEMNGKLFAISMLKQFLMNGSSKSLGVYDFEGESGPVVGSKEIDGSGKGRILVSQVAAAVAALHERFAFETRIKGIRASRFVPAYQRVQEHEYISKKADEERKKRPNYKPIIEHDGVLWNRGGNQDSNKNKSQEELLAEQRDYKRRRMSYRGKKMKRSTTEIMREIIDEYMGEIKRANMVASEPSSTSNVPANKHRTDESKQKIVRKESVSDISMRSARYEDEVKENNNKHRHKDRRSSKRTKDHSSSPNNGHRSKHKDKKRSSSVLQNEFDDRYDPSQSHDVDV